MEKYVDKTFEFKGETYTVDIVKDGKHFCCQIKEISGIIFQAEDENEIIKKSKEMISIWKKHENIWGMKNLKTKQFSFEPFGTSLRITLLSPYASWSWLWHWFRSKNIKSFTLRLFGINIYWAEKNSAEKLNIAFAKKYKR